MLLRRCRHDLARHLQHRPRRRSASHRLRSSLTMLGILIGIAAVILTVGLGEGAQQQVKSQINALGTNLLIVSPGSSTSTTGIRGGFGTASTLTTTDATALGSKAVAPDIAAVAPTTSSSAALVAGTTNWTTTHGRHHPGMAPECGPAPCRPGRFLTQADENNDGRCGRVRLRRHQPSCSTGGTRSARPSPSMACPSVWSGCWHPLDRRAAANNDDTAVVPYTTVAQRLVGGSAGLRSAPYTSRPPRRPH